MCHGYLFHRWGKWNIFLQNYLNIDKKTDKSYESKERWQRKTCGRCGFSKERRLGSA